MIDLQNLRNAINDGGFSDEAKNLMLPIVDAAIARGSMTAEEKKKLQDIMDVEVDQDVLEQGAHEEAAEAIEAFLAETDSATQTAAENIDDLEKEATEESQKIQNDLTNSAQGQVSTQPQAVPAEPGISSQPIASQPQPQAEAPQTGMPPLEVPPAEPPPWQPPTQ